MASKLSAAATLLAVVLAIDATVFTDILEWKPSAGLDPYPVAFKQLATDVYRQGYDWHLPNGQVGDVHVYLIKLGEDYVLVDVGAPTADYEQIPSSGLRQALQNGRLRLITLTHGHFDHVGALVSLMKEYPDVQVLFHEAEAPFLTGESGDISDAKGLSVQKPAWAAPRGSISFHRGHGHAPGHVSYLHKPSLSLIADDIFNNEGQPPQIRLPPEVFTPNVTEAELSLKKIAQLDFVKAFCGHDRAEGVTREALQQYFKIL
ncbi:hypothetical protein WJX75_000843 [Coccomyxa subellipsoidea]|uniref:Metallo-beta-lactamase domain-containing protein n=1 Tax=Coccomyxa subellipsoidea TaxID=248742 RepID=A0ABR2YYV7_9CHLO